MTHSFVQKITRRDYLKKIFFMSLFILESTGIFAENFETKLEYNRTFPIWGDKAVERGHSLPNPYGINFIYVDMKQDVDINKLELTGNLDLKKVTSELNLGFLNPIFKDVAPINLKDLISIEANTAESSNTNTMVRADMWVFPFLNVYALVGQSKGKSVAKIENTLNLQPILKPALAGVKDPSILNPIKEKIKEAVKKELGSFIGGLAGPLIDKMIDNAIKDLEGSVETLAPYKLNSDFTLEYEGFTYGAGMVLAGGYKNFFSMVDLNYTRTSLDIIEGEISAFVISPKVGINFDYKNTKNAFWIGAMYQNIAQTLRGNISDVINIPGIDGKFEVDERSSSPWNTVLGIRSEINKSLELTTEISLNKKKTFMFALGYRF